MHPPPDIDAERRRVPAPTKRAALTPPPLHHSDGLPPRPSKPGELNQYPPLRPRLKPPALKRTSPLAWFAGVCCALFWVVVILGGVAVLILYLIFRPRNPQLDIPQATLNAAYLDTDAGANATLLNADLTLLANFSNLNRRIDVVFALVDLDLYFGATLVAAAAVDPFSERRGESALRSLHMVASQVELPAKDAGEWRRQEEEAAAGDGEGMGVAMEVHGRMRTTLELGGLLRFSYWLRSRCRIVMGAPPGGPLRGVSCRTKGLLR